MTRTPGHGSRSNLPVRATCPDCGKIRYPSRREARRFAARLYQDGRARAYQCGSFWHLTSQGALAAARHRAPTGGTA